MKMESSFYVIVVFVVFINVNGQIPQSPCPGIFYYDYDGKEVYGVIRIPAPESGLHHVKVTVNLTLPALLFSNNFGQLTPAGIEMFSKEGTNERSMILKYRIDFPMISPLPKLTALTVNEEILCYNNQTDFPELAGPGQIITPIMLEHNIYTSSRQCAFVTYFPSFVDARQDDSVTFKHQNTQNGEPLLWIYQSLPAQKPITQTPPSFQCNSGISKEPETLEVASSPSPKPPVISPSPETPLLPAPAITLAPATIPLTPIESASIATPALPTPPVTLEVPVPSVTLTVPESSITPVVPVGNVHKALEVDSNISTQFECGQLGNIPQYLLIGGEYYIRGSVPWLVALMKIEKHEMNFICAGSLVSDRHIVTAASCIHVREKKIAAAQLIVAADALDLDDYTDSDVKRYYVKEVTSHSGYDSYSFKNNIAVLTLKKQVTFTDYVIPICLWDEHLADISEIVGRRGLIAGWSNGHGRPRKARIPIISTDECQKAHVDLSNITSDTVLCAGGKNKVSSCNANPGGGLYLRYKKEGDTWRLRGLVSVLLENENNYYEDECYLQEIVIFTDAAKYTPWIRSIMETT